LSNTETMGSQSTRDFTKVVIRQLPPTLQEADCKAAVDKQFADRYSWFSFARGKIGCVACNAAAAAFVPRDMHHDGATAHHRLAGLRPPSMHEVPGLPALSLGVPSCTAGRRTRGNQLHTSISELPVMC
jgi:Smg-4/UPF3 family